MTHASSQPPNVRRLAVSVCGVVQGVGFRPFVYNLARSLELAGWVQNAADMVRIEVQGEPDRLDALLDALRNSHPPQARVDSIDVAETACEHDPSETFEIRPSEGNAAGRPTIPADLATCADCLAEIRDPAERRYGYPFTNCTNCGPRWSIIERLPYDRARTSMARFAMCPDCRAEYSDPSDRRFHAQPIACPQCGPALRLLGKDGNELATGADALAATVEALRTGRIVAMKGLGGFQLLVDATSAEAVARLRAKKQRPDRPFAVMMPSLGDVRRWCEVSDEEARTLASHEAPIVLLRRRGGQDSDDVAEGVAPGNPYLGVMLPCTPMHHLLTDAIARPVVCTSGNLSEEPMAITTDDALRRLGPIADAILTHNRPIVRPVDDSVARATPDGVQLLRRARGYAPLPIDLGHRSPTILAVGGHLKNTVGLGLGSVRATHQTPVILASHIGDLEHPLAVAVHRRAARDLVGFFDAVPEAVACDLHPDYASTRHAEALAAEWGVPLVRVQHHHAHAAACMAEHHLDGPVLALTWDGTGYGPDATVWGGEALVCDGAAFTRVAHLRTFALPGGDRAVRQPRRSALGLLFEIMGSRDTERVLGLGGQLNCRPLTRSGVAWFEPAELATLIAMLERSIQCPRTSSMGRLFDAVAAICGLPAVTSFEGQAAMALEFAADVNETGVYPLPLSDDTPAVADWEPLVRAVLADRTSGVPVGQIAARFHNALAELGVAIARQAGCSQIVLSGGCFQNALLSQRLHTRLLQSGLNVYTHRQVPPGDGGIALGQVFIAARQIEG
ncbi:MAG: carbamoyltransferase HypF [Candidatus Nealsonbacteria bacterium]|nr:carbamoyltransferase HypF [Candidatus Nealsonbacteria bacterium]